MRCKSKCDDQTGNQNHSTSDTMYNKTKNVKLKSEHLTFAKSFKLKCKIMLNGI